MDDFSENKPLVTVIIPAYNHAAYIIECIDSVRSQTYGNLQIIVINDGSTDRTDEIVRAYISDNHCDIEYIRKANEGICRTLNLGLEKAKGKYVALIASDDVWLPTRIGEQVHFLESHADVGLVFSDAYFIRGTERTEKRYSDYKPEIRRYFVDSVQNRDLYKVLLIDNIVAALTVLIRKDCYDKVGNYDVSLKCEDLDMCLRVSKEYKIAYIDKPLAYYRIHGTNISGSSWTMIRETAKTLRKQFRQPPLKGHPFRILAVIVLFSLKKVKNKIVKNEMTS